MKPRRNGKPRQKFKFTLKVNHIIFPKAIARKLSSSKFYVLLSRADKSNQTKIGSISKGGKIEYNEEISLEATLLKNRSSNTYISKHCRIVLRQIKNSSNPNTKARQSSVGSIKFDLVDYIDRVPIEEKLKFAKCALDDVYIYATISAQEIDAGYDDNMSVASANTVRVDSFWLDIEEQKSPSPVINNYHMNGNGSNGYHHTQSRIRKNSNSISHSANNHDFNSEGMTDNEEQEGHNNDTDDDDDQGSDDTAPIQRKEKLRLTDKSLANFNHKQKDMAKFRIKHAMDVMANENNYFDDLYVMYEKEQKELNRAREKISLFEKKLKDKDRKIRHFDEEERKWNKSMLEWQRETSNNEASLIELNFKYQQEKQMHKETKKELSEISLSTKRIILEKQRIEEKYQKLVSSLSKDRNPLLCQLSHLQSEYDDLEESMVTQQNSFRETGSILEHDLEKQKRKTLKAVNELKKYKSRYERLKPENESLHTKIEKFQKELFAMKSKHEIEIAQIKFEANKQLVTSTNLINKLMITSQQNSQLENLDISDIERIEDDHKHMDNQNDNEPEIEFYDDDDQENDINIMNGININNDNPMDDNEEIPNIIHSQIKKKSKSKSKRNKLSSSSITSITSNSSGSTSNLSSQSINNVRDRIKSLNSNSNIKQTDDKPKKKKKRRGSKVKRNLKSSKQISDEPMFRRSVVNDKPKKKIESQAIISPLSPIIKNKSGPSLKKSPPRVSSLRTMKKKVEKEENMMIEQELLSPLRNDDMMIEQDKELNDNVNHVTDMSDLNNISDLLMNQVENGIMSDNEDNDDDDDAPIGHRHVRSHPIDEELHPQTLGIDINEYTANNNQHNLSDDDVSNLSESGSGNNNDDMTKDDLLEDID